MKSGRTIAEVAQERTDLSEQDVKKLLDPMAMTRSGSTVAGGGG